MTVSAINTSRPPIAFNCAFGVIDAPAGRVSNSGPRSPTSAEPPEKLRVPVANPLYSLLACDFNSAPKAISETPTITDAKGFANSFLNASLAALT